MSSPPPSTKDSLTQRLNTHARNRWPQLTRVNVRLRGQFAYIDGQLPDGDVVRLCRLRYVGYANRWAFAIYRASHEDYETSILPTGEFTGTAEQALDCACGLYLGDPTAWLSDSEPTPT